MAVPVLWHRVGALVSTLRSAELKSTRTEVIEALWHYYTPDDDATAAELLREYRLAALRQPLSAPPQQVHLRTLDAFWDQLGALAEQLQAKHGTRSSRSEITQALWWRYLPRDHRRAAKLIRAYRSTRLGLDPGAPPAPTTRPTHPR